MAGAGVGPDESMNSRVSWNVEGIDPSVRERAESAARRAGMSLSDWLNSTIGKSAPPDFGRASDQRPMPGRESRDVADIHQRLDSITRQIEQISRPAPRPELAARRARTRRARHRPAVERRHLAARCAAVADLKSRYGKTGLCAEPAASGRPGRARRRRGLSSIPATQPGFAGAGGCRNHRTAERT